jgi:hypothetical protein
VFRDSVSNYKKLFVGNDGKLQTLNLTLPDSGYKVDTADVEILNPANIYLTASNGTTFKISITTTGSLTSIQQAAPSQAIKIPGNFLIAQLHRGLIMRTSGNKRYKTTISTTGTIKTYLTSF